MMLTEAERKPYLTIHSWTSPNALGAVCQVADVDGLLKAQLAKILSLQPSLEGLREEIEKVQSGDSCQTIQANKPCSYVLDKSDTGCMECQIDQILSLVRQALPALLEKEGK